MGLTPSHILATDHSTIQSNDNHPVDLLTTVAATTVAQMEMTSIVNASVAYETVVMGDIEDLTITDSVCYLYSPNFGEGEFYPLDVEYTFLARSNQGTVSMKIFIFIIACVYLFDSRRTYNYAKGNQHLFQIKACFLYCMSALRLLWFSL